MNKRLRSRVLAASIFSTTFLGGGGMLFPQRALLAQERPTASALLDRGAALYDQKNYADAKKILTDIDPAQLPEDQRTRLADLLTKTDQALAAAMGPNQKFDAAEKDRTDGKLAHAATEYQGLIDDKSTPADVKQKAQVQLALVKQEQSERVPQMKELLDQAQTLYNQGKLDDAQAALAQVRDVGGDLGWDTQNRLPELEREISEKKLAQSRGAGGTVMAQAGGNPATGTAMAAPGTSAAATMPEALPNPMDVGAAGTGTAPATGEAPAAGGVMGQELASGSLMQQRALTQYRAAQRQAGEAMGKNQFQQAVAYAQESLDIIDSNRNYFSEVEGEALHDAAQNLLDSVNARAATYRAEQEQARVASLQAKETAENASLAASRRARVAGLVADAKKLYEATKFPEAESLLQQAVVVDPQDQSAKLLLRLVQDKITDRQYQSVIERAGTEVMRQNIDSAEHLIPYADLMVYPDNWPEITRKRTGGEASQDTAANRATRDKLEETLTVINADSQGLEKVLNYLRDNMGANIFVNWPALQTAGIDRNTPVTINLRQVPFRKALSTVLSEAGGDTAHLAYTIDDGIITISTQDDLNSAKYQLVRVFDIRDMLVQPNANQQPPRLNLSGLTGSGTQTFGSGGGGGGIGGGGGGGFGGGGGGGFGGGGQGGGGGGFGGGGGGGGLFGQTGSQQTSQSTAQQRTDLVNSITDTIKSTVAPDTWRDNGGTIGSIRELNGQLIVNQTVDNELAVFNLLQQLRETRAIQIAVEARLMLVDNNFLDDFRVGWDLTLPASIVGTSVPGGININNTNTFLNAVPGTTGVPGSLSSLATTPSLNLAASIVDNWTLSLLLTATQADKRTITVTAPRVTLFNGQPGYISVTNQQNIVESFSQTTASGGIGGNAATGTSLTIATLSTGVTLAVTATVSADRRYVVMTLDPQLATLDGIDTFTLGSGTSNTTANNTTGNNTTSNTTGSNTTNTTTNVGGAFVQLPKISTTEVNTMVSIPDGGTLLIGGQKLIGESEIEVGVPVLSKIPILNRLFTNRSYVKDERTLLVLVRPNIIIHKEIEQDLFGVGYDRPTGLPGNTGADTGTTTLLPAPVTTP